VAWRKRSLRGQRKRRSEGKKKANRNILGLRANRSSTSTVLGRNKGREHQGKTQETYITVFSPTHTGWQTPGVVLIFFLWFRAFFIGEAFVSGESAVLRAYQYTPQSDD